MHLCSFKGKKIKIIKNPSSSIKIIKKLLQLLQIREENPANSSRKIKTKDNQD